MTTIASYDLVGVKEDVSDIITIISPTKTPFQTMVGSEGVHQKLYQWLEDNLVAVQSNPQVEGASAVTAVYQAPIERANTTQIFSKTASVTGSTQKTATYGRGKELAYQLNMRGKELKRDLEWAYVGTGQSYVPGSDTTARLMSGFQAMIDPSTVYTAGGGIGFTGTTPARTTITEMMVLTTAEQLFVNGAEVDTLMIKPNDALNVANFPRGMGRVEHTEAKDKALVNVINVYECAYGKLNVVMNRFIQGALATDATSVALLFEAEMWKKAPFRPWFRQTLAITGDATNVQLLGEYGLMHKNFKASGLITNLQ